MTVVMMVVVCASLRCDGRRAYLLIMYVGEGTKRKEKKKEGAGQDTQTSNPSPNPPESFSRSHLACVSALAFSCCERMGERRGVVGWDEVEGCGCARWLTCLPSLPLLPFASPRGMGKNNEIRDGAGTWGMTSRKFEPLSITLHILPFSFSFLDP